MNQTDEDLPSYRNLFVTGIVVGALLIVAAVVFRIIEIARVQRLSLDEFSALLYSGVAVIALTFIALLCGLLTRWARELVTFREIVSRYKSDEALIKLALPHPWLKDIFILSRTPSTKPK